MAKPSSPSLPHGDKGNRHVDIRGQKAKQHVPVRDNLGAQAIGGTVKAQERDKKGRKP